MSAAAMSIKKTILNRYAYDPLDRLIRCTPLGQSSLQCFYNKNHLCCELQQEQSRRRVQHGGLLLAQQLQMSKVSTTCLLATDHAQTVLHMRDAEGADDLAYTAYGHRPNSAASGSVPGFNGERADSVTGHYPLGQGYRFYNPVLMRFNSPDSWSPFGEGGLNPYMYCMGDPINRRDPTGHLALAAMITMASATLGNAGLGFLRSVPFMDGFSALRGGILTAGKPGLAAGAVAAVVATVAGAAGAVVGGASLAVRSTSSGDQNKDLITGLFIAGMALAVLGLGARVGSAWLMRKKTYMPPMKQFNRAAKAARRVKAVKPAELGPQTPTAPRREELPQTPSSPIPSPSAPEATPNTFSRPSFDFPLVPSRSNSVVKAQMEDIRNGRFGSLRETWV